MSEPNDDDTPDVVDTLYSALRLGETTVSIQMNGFIRDEILRSLLRGGLMTKEALSAAIERGEKEIADMCIAVAAEKPADKERAELLERMKEKAKAIADHVRKEIIEPSS